MQSGIAIADNVREVFQELRMKRKHRYIIYKPSEDNYCVEVEKLGERSEDFESFKAAVPKNNSR